MFLKFFLFCILTFLFLVPDLQAEEVKSWREDNGQEETGKKEKEPSDQKKFSLMAKQILGHPHWSDRLLSLLDQDVAKIAVHPFNSEELPISMAEAAYYNNAFQQALVKEAKGRYAIVSRAELGALVKDIDEMGSRDDSLNPLGDLISRARSDLLAVGSLGLAGEKIDLSYKLVETQTGRIVSSAQQSFKRKERTELSDHRGLTVSAAAKKAVSKLMRDYSGLRKIMVQGVRYQSSGVHTGFGRYFAGVLVDELHQYARKGPQNINALEIGEFVIEEESFRGLSLAESNLERERLKENAGQEFILKGTYWPLSDFIEIRLTLQGSRGVQSSWRGKILRSDIDDSLELVPASAPIAEQDTRPLGPIDLYLTSNKGGNPSYAIGEKMVLFLRSREDAYVSCYYFQADNRIFRIYPNRYMRDAALQGGFGQYIPPAGMPFEFEFSPPSGVEAVKCFATDKDVSAQLDKRLQQDAFVALQIANERELTGMYRRLDNVALSEASLIISVQ